MKTDSLTFLVMILATRATGTTGATGVTRATGWPKTSRENC